jgi:DNA polymerase
MRTVRRTNILSKKLKAMRARVRSDNGYMSFGMLYFGASTTGRFSGADGVNMQNLPSSAMFGVNFRDLIEAPPGYVFVNVDSSQIEPRCLGWLTNNTVLLDSIRGGAAIYEAHARASMGWKGGALKSEDPDLYKLAKARVLALGYGAGAEKFIAMANTMCGLVVTPREAEHIVADFRKTSPEICGKGGIWDSLESGMVRSARLKETFEVELPTGRMMRYFRPSNMGGLSAETAFQGGMTRRRWWGGSLTENITQATAREVFVDKILDVEDAGYPVLFHVHDELTALVEEDKADEALRDILQIMCATPDFMPGLPLGAEGGIFKTYPGK